MPSDRIPTKALRGACALGLAAALGCMGAVHTDPAQAGPDYAIQGEFAGPGFGAQVVALGDGDFELRLLPGGLPGAGARADRRLRAAGARSGASVDFAGELRATLAGDALRGTLASGESFALERVERVSPTLGAAAPPGALVLFDGSGPGGFDGELDAEGNLAAGAVTRERFRDFELHLEFRTPFMPGHRGQQRGNSGVFLQDRYEIQVLDSFGLEGAANECGALYAQKAPDHNMALPPLRWQSYDLRFEAARFDAAGRRATPAVVTLRHNGVLVHDRVPLEGPMDDGDPEGPEPGPLRFQDLWIPVAYRNVWLLPLGAESGSPPRS